MARRFGARYIPLTTTQALNNTRLLGGPLELCGWSLNDGVVSQSLTTDTQQSAPGAGTTIASISLGLGPYEVEWYFELGGTPGAGDIDNVGLYIGSTLVQQSVNLGVAGTYGPFTTEVDSLFGAQTLAAKAIAAATAGTTYRVNITAIPQSPTQVSINDGGQTVVTLTIPAGGTITQWTSEHGVQFDNQISVQATYGNAQGCLYCYLGEDYWHSDRHYKPHE